MGPVRQNPIQRTAVDLTTNVLLISPSILFAFMHASAHWDPTFRSAHIITPRSRSSEQYSSLWFPMEYADNTFDPMSLPPRMTLQFCTLNCICQSRADSCKVFKSSWSFSVSSLVEILAHNFVSSANLNSRLWIFEQQIMDIQVQIVYEVKNREPRGTPLNTKHHVEKSPFIHTLWVRFANQLLIHSSTFPLFPWLAGFRSSLWCETLSNALAKSRNATSTVSPWSIHEAILSTNVSILIRHGRPFLKPCWEFSNNRLVSRY